ncbi:hypothetical protein NEMIN01_0121 [Nematocida minor]|uniref:uncharacterized protein n=1 Tax=Nematocida minor TaxID=1912983 RepID=UPI002220B123|nr:uncharacterized protein NEMIN01_0017 [Nematocida minor]XP_051332023.1 uncharacterized protein NEMIN01_0121 [Nematocida minor]KAI5188753.1 hypothetical protein NEMIN01_0017 [Nematocida minor]KAI5188857.1 hypothetical protein NEMIN01_0121 [Nematocida minor]
MEALYKLGNYKFKQMLGEGMYAVVYLAEQDAEPWAIKVINKGKCRKRGTRHAQKEIAALLRLGKKAGVVHLKEWRENETFFFIVLSYCPGYSLDNTPTLLSVQEILYTALSILETLKRIHSLGVFHLDIKPSNVIVSRHGACLVDFGCSIISENGVVEKHMLPFEGTPAYMAPEMIKSTDPFISLESLDVWSFGCLLYYLAAGKNAFVSASLYSLYPKILHCKVDYTGMPAEIEQICRKIFIQLPNERICLMNLIALVKSKLVSPLQQNV